jgi:uncharacterized protein YecT (DUF1311 family)
MRVWFAAAAVLALALVPTAADAGCGAPMTTVEMIECASVDLKAADDALNRVYKERMNGADELGRDLLRTAQRAWIKFRDAECELERDSARGGTLAPILQLSCLTHLTKRRTNDLRAADTAGMRGRDRAVAWLPGVAVDAPLGCLETPVSAKVGLSGGYDIDTDTRMAVAVVDVGGLSVDIPIGGAGQGALCGVPVAVEAAAGLDGCPALRVDDGLCDAVYVGMDDVGLLTAARAN